MSEGVATDGVSIAFSSVPDNSPGLSDLSERDKPWDKHRGNADIASFHYKGVDIAWLTPGATTANAHRPLCNSDFSNPCWVGIT